MKLTDSMGNQRRWNFNIDVEWSEQKPRVDFRKMKNSPIETVPKLVAHAFKKSGRSNFTLNVMLSTPQIRLKLIDSYRKLPI